MSAVSTIKTPPLDRNSNAFHFDTEIIIQLVIARKRIKEIAIPPTTSKVPTSPRPHARKLSASGSDLTLGARA